MIESRRLIYLLVGAAFLLGLAGGLVTMALLSDAESVSVTFRTATVAAPLVATAVPRPD